MSTPSCREGKVQSPASIFLAATTKKSLSFITKESTSVADLGCMDWRNNKKNNSNVPLSQEKIVQNTNYFSIES